MLFAESPEPLRFNYDDEDALAIFAGHLGAAMALLHRDEATSEAVTAEAKPVTASEAVTVRHYGADDSVFLGHDYLIKGVAGAIFWRLVREYVAHGRVEFSNRELRLDPVAAAAGLCGEPGGAADPALPAPGGAERRRADREMRARTLPPCRILRAEAGGDGGRRRKVGGRLAKFEYRVRELLASGPAPARLLVHAIDECGGSTSRRPGRKVQAMFEKLVRVSGAMAGQTGVLVPAMKGCPACGVVKMITGPTLGTCPTCGHEYRVVEAEAILQGTASSPRDEVGNA